MAFLYLLVPSSILNCSIYFLIAMPFLKIETKQYCVFSLIFQMSDQKVISNIYFSATEESETSFAQSKPHALGKESTLEKLKLSAVSTANGVKSLHDEPLAKDATDPSGSMEKTQPLAGLRESRPPQSGGKDDTPRAEGKKKDMEGVTEVQPLEGYADTEPLGTETHHQPLRTVGERDSPGIGGGTESPQTAGEMKPLGIAEKIPPLAAGREPQPQETMGKDEQPQLLETVSKETESPELLEGSQLAETEEEEHLQETRGRDEQEMKLLESIPKENGSPEMSEANQLVETAGEQQLQETVPKENRSPEILKGSHRVETAVKNNLMHRTPEGPGDAEQMQHEGTVGSMECPAGILETATNVEMVRKIHTNKENPNIEGKVLLKIQDAP